VTMFNRLSTCQPAFPHQLSCQPRPALTPLWRNIWLIARLLAAPRLRAWKALTRLRNSILCTLTGRFTCA
ncbi:TPA: hypothetical protein ACH9R9_005446, partial [Escherichia coli]